MKRAPTPETDDCVKENKHIRFLEENHWSLNGKYTYTHPIVELCRRLERQRDGLKSAADYASDFLYIAIAQRDALVTALEQCKEDSIELLEERSWWKNEPRCDYGKRYKDIENNIARADAALAEVKTTNQND